MDDFALAYQSVSDALTRLHLNDRREQEKSAGMIADGLLGMIRSSPSEEVFEKSFAEVNRKLFELIHSSSLVDKQGAVLAIDRIVNRTGNNDEDLGENLARYSNYLRLVLPAKDASLMRDASVCLGKIIELSGPGAHELVDYELNRVFQWLNDKAEVNQLAACYVADALLLNSSTISNAYLSTLFDALWALLRETKSAGVMEASSKAIKSVLLVVKSRYDPGSLQYFGQRTLAGLMEELKGQHSGTVQVSALLVLGHLLDSMADVMNLEGSPELFEILLVLLHQKISPAVRLKLYDLLPALAAQIPVIFSERFLARWIGILLDALKKEKDRTTCLVAVASTANALGPEIKGYVEPLTQSLRHLLLSSASRSRSEDQWLFNSIASLSEAIKAGFFHAGRTLVPLILQQEISEAAVICIVASIRNAPDMVPFVEDLIMAKVLAELHSGALFRVNLAIKLVTSTPFYLAFLPSPAARILQEYVGSRKLPVETRLLAVNALISHSKASHKPVVFCESYLLIYQVLNQVLQSCMLEGTASFIEGSVKLLNCPQFDAYWNTPGCISSLFSLFSCGTLETKLHCMYIFKRITPKVRALIRPHFQLALLNLASSLRTELASEDLTEACAVLEEFCQIDDSLMRPYCRPFLERIIEHVSRESTATAFNITALRVLNHLVQVSPRDFSQFALKLLGILVGTFQNLSSEALRLASLQCLGTILRCIDRSLLATHRYVYLIQEVILLLKIETCREVRNEALRLLGIIGAIDPYRMKTREIELAANDLNEAPAEDSAFVTVSDSTGQEDQYVIVSTGALLKVLKDPSLSGHYTTCIQALVYIFRSVKVKASPFLPQVLPILLGIINAGEGTGSFLEFYFQCLAQAVASVSLHIRPFAPELIGLIQRYWNPASTHQVALLTLLEALVWSLKGECRQEIGPLAPLCVKLLAASDRPGLQQRTLKVLAIFGGTLEAFMSELVRGLLQLTEQRDLSSDVHASMLKLLLYLSQELDFSEQLPSILRIIAGSFTRKEDARIQSLGLELALQLARSQAAGIKPHMRFLMQLAEEHHVVLSSVPIPGMSKAESVVVSEGSRHISAMLEIDTSQYGDLTNPALKKLHINEGNLRKAWEGFISCTSKEDWFDWIRRLGHEFIRESPSQAIRACSVIAASHHPIIKDILNVAFLSCWSDLPSEAQDELVTALEDAFASQEVPAEVIQTFLNLAEFMEHEEHPLPIDITTLGSYAIRCHAYAKALYYKELEFQANPSTAVVESLISLNSQLQLPDAAAGVLAFAEQKFEIKLKESWYEKLQQWDNALKAYELKWREAPGEMESLLGIFRCKLALGDWGGLSTLACDVWEDLSLELKETIAPWASSSAWGLSRWDLMGKFTELIPEGTIDGSFFRAILAVKHEEYGRMERYLLVTRERLDAELTAMINESYSRAYRTTVRIQMLSELEEVVQYTEGPERREAIRDCWNKRLADCQESVDVWQRMLKIRSLVIDPGQEEELWIKFAGLCRRMGRPVLSRRVILALLDTDEGEVDQLDLDKASPPAIYGLLEDFWDGGDAKRALDLMRRYTKILAHQLDVLVKEGGTSPVVEAKSKLLCRCYIRLGKWQRAKDDQELGPVMDSYMTATSYDRNSYKAWHGWALTNFDLAAKYEGQRGAEYGRPRPNPHIVPAIQGFFRSISLAPQDDGGLQDSLRLLTLWFRYGSQPEVNAAVGDGFYTVPVDNWLQVIPQLIARIHVPSPQVRRLVHHVLTDIGRQHPQALLYPLTVASKAQSIPKRTSALAILDKMKSHSARLVEQAVMVSQELIRVAITWEEAWYEALEEASKIYFGEKNVVGMLQTLEPLHAQIERSRETQRETNFYQQYGPTLNGARDLCQKYKKTGSEEDLKEAWDLYYQVFKKISKQLPQLTCIDLEGSSPKLLTAKNLDIPIPGSYKAGKPIIKIASVASVMTVIASKQRPRKLIFIGSDGRKYKFLLKGHEDLRQDERVMQLFGLVNTLLSMDRETAKRHLTIQRFSVVPLSQNTGLIGWVSHCDTIHTLIRDYRESRGVLLSAEHRMMLQFAPDYDSLTEIQKVEVFDHALHNTDGMDLNRVLWKKSKNAESWLDTRTTFTRSLAVMSMVGYILGLGDRHPSNLMIDQVTGRVVHIDFGDCFDVAREREKFPEKVPFRLTRMLIKTMEVSRVEGTFRIVCEHTMRVLRENKDSVMAVLEAFIYDPLINWRILARPSDSQHARTPRIQDNRNYSGILDVEDPLSEFPENFSTTRRARLGTEISRLEEESINRPDATNAGAMNVINRVSSKLTGKQLEAAQPLDIQTQVGHLILDATKVENLCQAYVGWCPFW